MELPLGMNLRNWTAVSMLCITCSQNVDALSLTELTMQAPPCAGKESMLPAEIKLDRPYRPVRSYQWVDFDADGHCDVVGQTQASMEDGGEQDNLFYLWRKSKYVKQEQEILSEAPALITPVYVKNHAPPFLVIFTKRNASPGGDYSVWRWEQKQNRFGGFPFVGFYQALADRGDPDTNMVMQFYTRYLINKSSQQIKQGDKLAMWQGDEIRALTNTMDSEKYKKLREELEKLVGDY